MATYCASFEVEKLSGTRSVPSPLLLSTVPFLISTGPFRNGSVFACSNAGSSPAE